MGAIAGVFARRGNGPSDGELAAMSRAVEHRGPAGESLWTRHPVGLVHRRDRIAPAWSATGQPLTDASGRYSIVMSGRIFNWTE